MNRANKRIERVLRSVTLRILMDRYKSKAEIETIPSQAQGVPRSERFGININNYMGVNTPIVVDLI